MTIIEFPHRQLNMKEKLVREYAQICDDIISSQDEVQIQQAEKRKDEIVNLLIVMDT